MALLMPAVTRGAVVVVADGRSLQVYLSGLDFLPVCLVTYTGWVVMTTDHLRCFLMWSEVVLCLLAGGWLSRATSAMDLTDTDIGAKTLRWQLSTS